MGDIKYTQEQQKVIDTRGANVLVSAAAGSGKTQVLGARIVSLLTDKEQPLDIDRILIVTFTKAAAAEMRERIGKMIGAQLALDPANKALIRQQSLLHNSKITTIDSFCLFVVRNNFGDIDVDPGFRIMDAGEGELLLRDTLEDILESHYSDEEDQEFIHLVECYAQDTREGSLEEIILKLHNVMTSHPFPEEYLLERMEQAREHVDDIFASPMGASVLASIEAEIASIIRKLRRALDICNSDGGPSGSAKCIIEKLDFFERLKEDTSYEKRYKLLSANRFLGRLSSKVADEELAAIVKAANEDAKALEKSLKEDVYFDAKECVEEDLAYVSRAARELYLLVLELYRGFIAAKREKNIVDFSDMEHMALNILLKRDEDGVLRPTDTAMEYRDYFQAVMVDEYQDSNDIQEYILKSITGDDNYFMVGDVKQSIYKFRQAKPAIFAGKYDQFEYEGINTKIDLNQNFRSRKSVIDFVNKVFEKVMTKTTASMDYDDAARLKAGAKYSIEDGPDYKSQVLIVEKPSKDADMLDIDDAAKGLEAAVIADKIREMIKSGMQVYDKQLDTTRDVTYKDFVILIRSTGEWVEAIKDALEKVGIPAYANTSSGYFDAYEVKAVLNLLAVVDNPRGDIALAGVLFSYFGGFTYDEAAMLRAAYPDRPLWEGLREYAAREDELAHKASKLVSYIETLRQKIPYTQIRSLIEEVLYDSGYMDYVRAMKSGEARVANLMMLLEKAGDYEKTSYHGLFRFNRYIDMLRAREVDYGEAGVLDENANVVRIMTIHKSKGLEFPVCFVAGMGKKFNTRDASSKVLFETDYGLGLSYINPYTRQERKSLKKTLMSKKIVMDMIAEELRVLYVALTRAREKLIITGTVRDYDKLMESCSQYEGVDESAILSASTFLDIIVPSISGTLDRAEFITKVTYEDLTASEMADYLETINHQDDMEHYKSQASAEDVEALAKVFSTRYAHEALEGLYHKTTVTELKKLSMHDEESVEMFEIAQEKKVPKFIAETQKREGTKTGSAYHRVQELIDHKSLIGANENLLEDRAALEKYIRELLAREVASGRLSDEYYQLVSVEKCVNFLQSDAAMRMCKADQLGQLYKEKPFFMGIEANRIDSKFPKDELVLVQGVIDVCFLEDDEYVILDYKTDKVNSADALVKRYSVQLEYYKEALSRLTGKHVKECLIYSSYLNELIKSRIN